MRFILVFILSGTLLSCGTYRVGAGGYRGMGDYKGGGEFKTSSDYSNGIDSAPYSESEAEAPRGRLNSRSQYIPRGPFKLFWPVERVHLNRGFHPASDPAHSGLDLGGRKGMPILSAHEGMVIYVGRDFNGYGNMILIEFNSEWATLYGHLDSFSVKEGMLVKPGDPIGGMGATGHATGVHLHFEVLHNRQPVDPLPMLTKTPKYASIR